MAAHRVAAHICIYALLISSSNHPMFRCDADTQPTYNMRQRLTGTKNTAHGTSRQNRMGLSIEHVLVFEVSKRSTVTEPWILSACSESCEISVLHMETSMRSPYNTYWEAARWQHCGRCTDMQVESIQAKLRRLFEQYGGFLATCPLRIVEEIHTTYGPPSNPCTFNVAMLSKTPDWNNDVWPVGVVACRPPLPRVSHFLCM